MVETMRVLSRGESALMDRLGDEASAIKKLKLRLQMHRAWRGQLILKARRAGFTVREIEKVAGISNVEVSRISRTSPARYASEEHA